MPYVQDRESERMNKSIRYLTYEEAKYATPWRSSEGGLTHQAPAVSIGLRFLQDRSGLRDRVDINGAEDRSPTVLGDVGVIA